MSKSSAASDPLYHDVSPEYVRYTRLFFMFTVLICFTSIICAIVQAHDEKKFYIIIISLVVSIVFVLCIYLFFQRRILLAEKLWFVNLTIFILFLQAIIYLIFVFIKPYPIPITTTFQSTTPFSTTPSNSTTNMTNITSTTVSSTTTKLYSWNKEAFLTKLYEQIDDM
ncbi:unnamed protein product [Adineta steineri]|uniref:Uncharacterized protein n=1 Tax=Adineta steineri TaxID=433720 RepID=A0A818K8F7_9BILA|nr:unnamed protein product [Adineta steineri]CAF0942728.1 unnamed protein product [Adineta steineri]CAF0968050.1 unnamed protein product [Adineta steineri]CAF0968129.1 unnamed protein product [Adineta steineri]CAF0979497.1 unnamed protein product [Adineta steineri]